MKLLSNRILEAVRLIREKEFEAQTEQARRDTSKRFLCPDRGMAFDLIMEVFSILSRCGQQEQARLHHYHSELSQAAKIEYAKEMESKGLDWEH